MLASARLVPGQSDLYSVKLFSSGLIAAHKYGI